MKSIRGKARQNLLVATVNAALERGLITLECETIATNKFEFELGGMPVVGRVRDINGCAIVVMANVMPTELGRNSFNSSSMPGYRKFGAATVSSFLYRMDKKCLQTAGEYHGTDAVTERLARLSVIPMGFGVQYGDGKCREIEDVA